MDNKLTNRFNSLKKFKKELNNYFINIKSEWIDINVTPLGRVDLTIVSNKFEDDESESLEFIEASFQKLNDFYHKGFTTFYSVEDANFSGIKQPLMKKDKSFGWESMLKGLESDQEVKKNKVKVDFPTLISFYSYKGGVGRTLALVQTAYLLAQKGKNVLMLDLDIEAPSLYEIFSDKMDLEKGIVDYLYEQEFGGEEQEINIDDIVSNIQVEETLEGNLYTIPAGIMSAEYIFKLTQLKPKFLSQREYLSNLFKKLRKKLDIDIVLIDSRTGINDWGAFSILDMADEVFFFTYPNRENLKGTKVIVDLIKSIQLKKFTIIFSRVESDEGLDYAKELFKELDLKQKFISIVYNPRLAVIKEFPNDKFLDEYQEIADFILEKDQLEINKNYILNQLDKKDVLEELLTNIKEEFYITEAENKLFQDRYNYIVADSQIIKKRFSELFNHFKSLSSVRIENESKLAGFVKNKLIYIEDENFLSAKNYNEMLNYFYYILNTIDINKRKIDFNTDNFVKEDYLKMKDGFSDLNLEQRIQKFKDLTLVEKDSDDFIPSNKEIDVNVEVKREINLVINLDILNADYLSNEKIEIVNQTVEFIKKHFSKIKIKIIISNEYYRNNSELFTDSLEIYKLEWRKDDLKKLLLDYLRSVSKLEDYRYAIKRANNVSSFVEKIDDFKRKEREVNNKSRSDINLNDFLISNRIKNKVDYLLNLFWGIRVNTEIYSEKIMDCFYNLLKENELMNPIAVKEILIKAIKFEIENCLDNKESLISKKSLENSFD